jgi:CheY-like chemotaxis protein
VVTVTSAKVALDLIEQGERFDLVLSDIMMPQMTGMDLYAELSRRLPDHAQKMIFMTGGAFSEEAASFLQKVSNPSIEKPFTAKSLRRFLRTMLA